MSAANLAVGGWAGRVSGPSWAGILAVATTTMTAGLTVLVETGLAPGSVPEYGRPLALTPAGIAGAAALVAGCWLIAADRPAAAVGISLVSVAWLLPALATWPALSPPPRAAVLAAAPLAVGGATLIATGWGKRAERLGGREWTVIGLAVTAAAAHLLGYDPFFDPACSATCEASPAWLSTVIGARPALGVSAALTAAAATAALLIIWPHRSAPTTLRIASAVIVVLAATASVLSWWRWGDPRTVVWADRLQTAGTLVLAGAVIVVVVRTAAVRRNVREVVANLSGSMPVRGLAGSVTAVYFAVPQDGRWVDAGGRSGPSGEEKARDLILSDADGPAVRLILNRWAEPAQVAASVSPAARLALENTRLTAAGLVRLADVQSSQRRIVEVVDAERRRIERDLHDGAQQRLVAVSMQLSSGRRHADQDGVGYTLAAESAVRHALATLRELSHGNPAAVLDAEGFSTAIEELAAVLPLSIDIEAVVDENTLSGPVQTAAYLAIAAGLNNVVAHAKTERAQLFMIDTAGELTVRIIDAGRGGAQIGPGLTAVADRVGALGGHIELAGGPGEGTALTVRMPCAS